MGFKQQFNAPVQNVYNVEGTLILSADSRAPDLVRELTAMRGQIAAIPGLDEPTRTQVTMKLDKAEGEAKEARPSGATIKDYLEGAAKALEGASGVAETAEKFAKTLVRIGSWAATLLT